MGIWAPGALVNDEPRGIELTLTDGGGNISYADLARAMVAMVEDGDAEKKWTGRGKEMKHVGMVPLGGKAVAGMTGDVYLKLLQGLLACYAPELWRMGNRRGWWS